MERISMIGEDFTFRTYNGALVAYGSRVFAGMQWIGYPDACKICEPFIGSIYRAGQFMPKLPKHPHCLLPDTLVQTKRGLIPIQEIVVGDLVLTHKNRYREVLQTHRNYYDGKTVNIMGNWLTANHPVLTPKGWVRADNLQNLTDVLTLPSSRNSYHAVAKFNANKFPSTTIQQNLLSSIIFAFNFRLMPISPINFNSNFNVWKSKIQVINFNRVLLNIRRQFISIKQFNDSLLQKRRLKTCLFAKSMISPFSKNHLTTSYRIMCRFNLCLSLLRRHLTPLQKFRFSASPRFNSTCFKSMSNYTPRNIKTFSQRVFRNTFQIIYCNLLNRQIVSNISSRLISHIPNTPTTTISNGNYKGFVYNLSIDEDETYTVGKQHFIVHNCRCTWQLTFKESD